MIINNSNANKDISWVWGQLCKICSYLMTDVKTQDVLQLIRPSFLGPVFLINAVNDYDNDADDEKRCPEWLRLIENESIHFYAQNRWSSKDKVTDQMFTVTGGIMLLM